MATYHIRPRPKGNPTEWAVEKGGSSRASAVLSGQIPAEQRAKEIADDGDTLVFHSADGSVRGRRKVDKAAEEVRRKDRKSALGGLRF